MKTRTTLLMVLIASSLLTLSGLAQHKSSYSSFGQDETSVQKLEQQWTEAIVTGQTATLQKILGDDYTVIGPDGKSANKAQEIGLWESGDVKLDSLTVQDMKVRVYVGVAVVTGMMVVKGKANDKDISGDYRFMDLVEPRKEGWKAVIRQITKVETKKNEKEAQQ